MGEEDVRIPIKMEVDSSDLQNLKSEVEKTFKEIHEYENKRSTKKDHWNVKDVSNYESQVNSLLDKMRQLQGEFDTWSKKTPFEDLKRVQSSIGAQIKLNAQAQKDISSEHMRSLSYLREQQKAEEEVRRIDKEQLALRRQYNKAVKSVDPESRGAKSQLKDLEKQYKLQRQQLEADKMSAQSRVNINKKFSEEAAERERIARQNYSDGQKTVSELREQASSIGKVAKQEGYVQRFEEQRRSVLEGINRQLREMEELVTNIQYKSRGNMQQDIKDTGYQTPREKAEFKVQERARKEEARQAAEMAKIEKQLEAERAKTVRDVQKEERDAEKAVAQAHRDAEAATKAQIKELNAEAAAIKQTASQYYYKLRSIKMLGFVVNQVNNTLGNLGKKTTQFATKALSAYLKLIPGVNALKKALDKTSTSQKKLNREVKSTTKSHEGFNVSLKKAITTILKYGFGIRSLYILINKLRKAITEGIGEMSKQFDDVNSKMSIILTEINFMKASLTAMVQPIINLLAPAFEKLSAVVAKISYQVSSFVALLTGQDYVYKAIKIQSDYAASLDKTSKSVKKARKELAGFDELNVLHSDSDDEDTSGLGWEIVPAMEQAAGWIDKIKDMLSKLLEPLKNAWENMKDFVLSSWNTMVQKLKSLLGTIWDDFLKVWTDGRVQKIFENLLKILGDIFLIIGNIAEAIEEAWRHNDNGYRILSAIVDIIGIIVEGLKDCADYTVEWSKKLSFIPLFDAIADVMENQVVPAVQKVVDLFVYLYENIFLEIVRYVVEELAPILVKVFGNIIETIGNIAENIRTALEENDRGAQILQQIETLVTIVANGILEASEKTKEWSKNLDFANMFDAILNFLTAIQPMVQFLVDTVSAFWTEVLLPFWSYLVEDGGPKLLDLLSQIFGQYNEGTGMGIDWEHLTEVMHRFMTEVAEPMLELAWDVLVQIIKDLGQAFDDFVNSGTLDIIVDKFSEWIQNADPEDIAHKLENLVKILIEVKAAFALLSHVILPVVTGFMTLQNFFMQNKMASSIADISQKIATLSGTGGAGASGGGLTGLVSAIGGLVGPILIVVGVLAVMVGAFGGVEETIAEVKERVTEAIEFFKEFAESVKINESFDQLKESAKTAFDSLSVGLEALRPLFEEGLNALRDIVELVGGEVMAVIDGATTALAGLMEIIGGVSEILGGLFDLIAGFITNDKEKMDTGLAELAEGFGTVLGGAIEVVTGLFEFLGDTIANIVNVVFPEAKEVIFGWVDDTKETLGKWKDDVIGFFQKIKHDLIGDPIVYDIRDGIIEGFGEWISTTVKDIGEWVKDVAGDFVELKDSVGEKVTEIKEAAVTKFTELGESVGEKATALKDGVVNGFTYLKDIMTGESKEATDSTANNFTTMTDTINGSVNTTSLAQAGTDYITGFKTASDTVWQQLTAETSPKITSLLNLYKNNFTITALANNGTEFIKGFSNSVSTEWKSLTEKVVTWIKELVDDFKSNLTSSTLIDAGKNLIQGLSDGLMSALSNVLTTVTNICHQITERVQSAFQIHSPSKVFKDIGMNLMRGMEVGVEDETSAVTDAFKNIIPDDVSNNFADRFILSLKDMKSDAIAVISDMSKNMTNIVDNMDLLSSADTFYNKLSKLDNLKIPAIATGNILPSNIDFKRSAISTQLDTSQIAEAVKSAMIESMDDMRYNNSDSGDIVLQIDGYEIFRAVRNQNDIFRASTGYGAL